MVIASCKKKRKDFRPNPLFSHCLKHEFFTKTLSIKDVEDLKHPPADGVPPKDKDGFLARFDSEDTKMDTEIKEDDLRYINDREDQVFNDFAQNNINKVKHYQR